MSDESIYCLQTVSKAKTYLLPSVAVLDILPFSPIDRSLAKGVVLGHFDWKDTKVPVIDLSLENSTSEVTPLTHIMIVQYPTQDRLGVFGALISQIPNAVSIGLNDLVFEGEIEDHLPKVRGQNIEAHLVDLIALGNTLSKAGL